MTHRLIALDIGTVRIGIAMTDETNKIATPYRTLHLKEMDDPIAEIGNILQEYNVPKIVVGWPLELDGSEGAAVRRTRKFLSAFKTRFPDIKIIRQDERMTSMAAENALQEMNVTGSDKKNHVDSMAASLILQMYLERRH